MGVFLGSEGKIVGYPLAIWTRINDNQDLSPPQRTLCVVGRLGKKKKRARGERGEGEIEKRGSHLFSLPIVPRALFFFFFLFF